MKNLELIDKLSIIVDYAIQKTFDTGNANMAEKIRDWEEEIIEELQK